MSVRFVKGALPLILAGGIAASLGAQPAFAQGTTPPPAPAKKADPVKPATTPAPGAKPGPAQPSTATKQAESGVAEAKPPADPAAPAADPEKEGHRAIYISLDIGAQRVDVGGLSDNTGFDDGKTAANGLAYGVGIGYRFKEFRIGGRLRDSSTTEYTLRQIMGEIGWGLPFRPISPVFMVHGGYVFDTSVERSTISSSLPQGNVLTPDVDLNGAIVGGEVSAPFWLTKFLRVGPFVGADILFLHRSTVSLPQSLFRVDDATRNNALYNDSGSGTGYAISIGIRGTGDVSF